MIIKNIARALVALACLFALSAKGEILRIEAEHYLMMSGINTQATADVGGGLNIGWMHAGDWMIYAIDLPQSGLHKIRYRVSSEKNGGIFQLESSNQAILDTVQFLSTGGFQNWITVETIVNLPAGAQELKIKSLGAGWNINWFEIESGQSAPPASLDIKIEAEHYVDMFGVRTQATSDAGGGLNVGYIDPDDWMTFEINVPEAGAYIINYRVSSQKNGGWFQLESAGGQTIYDVVQFPATGHFQTWTDVKRTINLPAGPQEITIKALGSGWNMNWFTIQSVSPGSSSSSIDSSSSSIDSSSSSSSSTESFVSLTATPERCDIIRPSTTCTARVTWKASSEFKPCLFKNNEKVACSNEGFADVKVKKWNTQFKLVNGLLITDELLDQATVVGKTPPTGKLTIAPHAQHPCVPTSDGTCKIDVVIEHVGGLDGVDLYKDGQKWGNLGTSGESPPWKYTLPLTVAASGTHYTMQGKYEGGLYEMANLMLHTTTFSHQGYSLTSAQPECTYNPLTEHGCKLYVTWTLPAADACIFFNDGKTGFCPDSTMLTETSGSTGSAGIHYYRLRKGNSPTAELLAQVAVVSKEQTVARITASRGGCSSAGCKALLGIFTNYEGNVCLYDNDVLVEGYCGLHRHSSVSDYMLSPGPHKLELVLEGGPNQHTVVAHTTINGMSQSSSSSSSSESSTSSQSSASIVQSPELIDGFVNSPPPTEQPQGPVIGVIGGKFRVNESGAANYSVPLSLPAGTAGVKPQLSFDYSSQAGVGILGQGWTLSGLSAITRCRQTLIHDNTVAPITWTKEDRFCLDGQRLMLSSGAYYGQSGSQYRLEIDNFSLITAVGGSDGHPAYFKVEAKDGSVSFFGYTADSQLTGGAANTTLTWAINRFQDNVGNGIDFIYRGDAPTGHYIHEVRYAFSTPNGSGPSGSRSDQSVRVKFNYSAREDVKRAYVAGYSFSQTQLLKSVDVFNNDEDGNTHLYRHYALSYMDQISVDQRYENNIRRLEHIHECVSSTITDNGCIEPLTFLWGGGSHIGYTKHINGFNFMNVAAGRYLLSNLFADVTGDGKLDMIYLMYEAHTTEQRADLAVYISHQNNTGFDYTTRIPLSNVEYEKVKIANLDYNADGRQDLALYDGNTWKIYLAKIDSRSKWSIEASNLVNGLPALDRNTTFVDVNSDGLADAVTLSAVRLLKRDATKPLSSATAYSFSFPQSFNWDAVANSPLVNQWPARGYSNCSANGSAKEIQTHTPADFNGDGSADFIGVYTKKFLCNVSGSAPQVDVSISYQFALINQNGTLTVYGDETLHARWSFEHGNEGLTAVDINGDGLTDIVKKERDDLYTVRINTGAGFEAAREWVTLTGLASKGSPQYLDYNGDGTTDIVWNDQNASQLKVKYWEETDFRAPISIKTTTGTEKDAHFIMDVTGDGVFDYIKITSSGIEGMAGALSVKNPAPICHQISTPSGMKIVCVDPSYSLDPAQQHKFIYQINNGLGNITQIHYGTLSNSGHYKTMDVNPTKELVTDCPVGAPCTPTPSYYTHDASAFYSRLNGQWELPTSHRLLNDATGTMVEPNPVEGKNHPVLEVNGNIQIVTAVKSSAPLPSLPSAMSEVRYYYGEAKMQAMGRGFLGFNSLKTIDVQSGITTVTRYRQDFPFNGRPLTTTVYENSRADAQQLSHAINNWDAKIFGDAGARRYQPYIKQSKESTYILNSMGEVSTEPLQEVTTDTTLHSGQYGNPHFITTTTTGGGNTLTKTVVNEYYPEEWAQRMGRLKSSNVSTNLNGQSVTRTAQFTYHGVDGHGTASGAKGLLKEEILSATDAAPLVTEYLYDNWGNKRQVKTRGLAEPGREETRTTTHTYDSTGRFLVSSNNDFGHLSTFSSYNKFGSPAYVTNINGVTTEVRYNKFGQEYLRIEKLPGGTTGAWSRTDSKYCSGDCPDGARYYQHTRVAGGGESKEYFDVLGRTVRSAKTGFDGRWINVDTEYDNLSRIENQSSPYFHGEFPAGWTTSDYDSLGRVTRVTSPGSNGEVVHTTITYAATILGLETTTTNPLGQVRKEVHNGLGQLVYVEDQLGGSLTYEHSPLGELLSVTSSAPDAQDVVVRMCYDDLGRKIGMFDPDKGGFKGNATASCGTVAAWQGGSSSAVAGWWHYRYNAFGELLEQRDPKGQSSHLVYDSLGRMVNRKDYLAAGGIEAHTAWFYDRPLDGSVHLNIKGKLTAVIMSTSGSDIIAHENSCLTGTNHCVMYNYNGRAQPDMVWTRLPDGQDYFTETKYDTIGRAYEQRDVIQGSVFQESGVQTQYNAHGFAYRTVDIAPWDGSNGVLSTILEMNERGQVTREARANGLTTLNTYNPSTGFLESQTVKDVLGLRNIQSNTYTWDEVGNLKSRHNRGAHIGLDPNSTTQKNQQEGFCYDALNRLIDTLPTLNPGCGGTPDVTYDGLGNIKSKAGVGAYEYNRADGGPHAVTKAGNTRYTYDNNGNMTAETNSGSSAGNRTFTYTSYDMVKRISRGGNSVEFNYGPDRTRWQRIDKTGQSKTTTTTYLGNVERIQTDTGFIEWKRQVAGVVFTYKTSTSDGAPPLLLQKDVLYLDHLGSVDVITNSIGKVTHSMGFDPWGARRDGESNNTGTWNSLSDADRHTLISNSLKLANFSQPITTRGYTGHEMVDGMDIIHMNGRIYDAKLGRFLQADPFIQESTNTQSYNRYSYLMNNPLNATDPSGFFLKKLWDEIRPFVGLIVAVVATWACGNAACGEFAWAWIGAASGAAGAAANGGDVLQGALMGMAMASIFQGIGQSFTGGGVEGNSSFWSMTAEGGAAHVFTHAVAGGVFSVLQGGKFGHGFLSAGVAKGMDSKFNLGNSGGEIAAETIVVSVVGGTVSKATGGKFANGAITAAFAHLFNEMNARSQKEAARQHYLKYGSYPRINGERQVPSTWDKLVRGIGVISGVEVLRETSQFMIDNPDLVNGVQVTADLATVPFKAVRLASDSHLVIESSAAAYNGAYGDAAIGMVSLLAGSGAKHFLTGFGIRNDTFINTSALAASKTSEILSQQDCFTCVK